MVLFRDFSAQATRLDTSRLQGESDHLSAMAERNANAAEIMGDMILPLAGRIFSAPEKRVFDKGRKVFSFIHHDAIPPFNDGSYPCDTNRNLNTASSGGIETVYCISNCEINIHPSPAALAGSIPG